MPEPPAGPSVIEEAIIRMKGTPPEKELECLEAFLYALTIAARIAISKTPAAERRWQILANVNEINHRVLNRVRALRGEDDFFTIEYTWKAVGEHARVDAHLEAWVEGAIAAMLTKLGV
jgi:hypothetical protein